jgi:hypothetical protein
MSADGPDTPDAGAPLRSDGAAARRRRVAVAATSDTSLAAETSRMAAGHARQARAMLDERREHLAAAQARLRMMLDAAEPRLARAAAADDGPDARAPAGRPPGPVPPPWQGSGPD